MNNYFKNPKESDEPNKNYNIIRPINVERTKNNLDQNLKQTNVSIDSYQKSNVELQNKGHDNFPKEQKGDKCYIF